MSSHGNIVDSMQLKQADPDRLEMLEKIIALMPGHVYWVNKEGVYLGCNDRQAKAAGIASREEIVGKRNKDLPWNFNKGTLPDALDTVNAEVMKTGEAVTVEEPATLIDGTEKIFLSNKVPLLNSRGSVIGMVGISIDITDRKKLEADLIKSKELAESANRAKTEFLENMRHDLRTPLTGIVGFAQLIKKEAMDIRINEYADNLVAASDTLLEFLNEILEAIKIMSGDTPIVRRKFNLEDIVQKIILLMKPKALEKDLIIHFNYNKKIPRYLIGDCKRIQRILLELISNALNFTHGGHVTISIDLAKEYGRECVIKCTVEDTGIGIPDDQKEEIFLRFKRLIPSYKGIYKGAGLGLAIAKQFIDDVKGEIYCQSQLEKGTTFTCLFLLQESLLDDDENVASVDDITYPKAKAFFPTELKNRDTKISADATNILLVEDQVLAAKVAESIITSLDCFVSIAKDGNMALKLIEENNYDLIFMDVGLPDIDGCEVTKEIRANESELDGHVPIVGLTAHVDSENKKKCIASGMDAVLSKPLSVDTAKDILNAFVPARKATQGLNDITEESKEMLLTLTGEYVDMNDSIKKANGDVKAAKEMLSLLVAGFKEDLPSLESAKSNNDWDTIQKIVHKQRGGACYCGVPRFLLANERLEECLRSNKTILREELYQQFMNEMESISKLEPFKN